jgi:hypothetical protein
MTSAISIMAMPDSLGKSQVVTQCGDLYQHHLPVPQSDCINWVPILSALAR